ncbi:hypothetical protein PR001_g24294 [Phytophthora rubi]|uniref:Uncharacterized protein n=1 Tax=Phytophthora rubi TaxID=129364 RepID=A0A6A3IIJ2_9STRA|nr:hypothetical protein PR001_g24294 [Phytophthora rubi]
MFALFEEVPTSTSLLMQCGYRSKVCTNIRATKIDGSLHKLCEFHRRKANANQQRLHKRQREERYANGVFNEELATPTSLTSVDMDMLELLLLDVQPLPLLPPPNSPTSVDEANSIVV